MTEKGVRVVYNEANTYEKIFNHYLHKIYEFGPDFIIDILGERTIFDYILIHDYPIITVPLGGFSSCAVFDYIVVRDMQAVRATNKQYYSVDENKAVEGNLYLPYDGHEEIHEKEIAHWQKRLCDGYCWESAENGDQS